MDAGCDDFIPKPVRAEDLLEKVGVHLDLEWIYETETGADLQPKPEERPLVAPPPEKILPLYEFAQKGHIVPIREQIDRIERLGDPFIPFVTELRRLAKGFHMKQMCAFLELYLGETE